MAATDAPEYKSARGNNGHICTHLQYNGYDALIALNYTQQQQINEEYVEIFVFTVSILTAHRVPRALDIATIVSF